MTGWDVHTHLVPPTVLAAAERGEHAMTLSRSQLVIEDRDRLPLRRLGQPPALLEWVAGQRLDGAVVSVPPMLHRYHLTAAWAQLVNEGMAAIGELGAGRLRVLGHLPLSEPPRAAGVAREVLADGRFSGFALGTLGIGFADPALDELWEVLDAAGSFVLLHPGASPDDRLSPYYLANLLGNPYETALAAAGLVFSDLLARSPGRTLVDLSLFRSARFTWGTIIAGLGIFAFFGLMFVAPQYFQAVLGTDAMGSGVRLLPLLGGMMIGAGTADRIADRVGAKITVAAGFLVLAGAMALATATTATSGYGLAATWSALGGLGAGLALATASSAALSAMSAERAGVASALMQAVQKVGAPLAAAILGSVLNAGYQDRLHLAGLPGEAATAVRDSVFAGVEVADRLGSAALLTDVRTAFVHGLDQMLLVSAAVAVVGAVLTLWFLPARATRVARDDREQAESGHEVAV